MFWAIVGPELVLSVAIGQYASARRSVKRFRKLCYPKWTLRHAFFADTGGILLQPVRSTPFLVNGRQLAYLVEKGYLEYPNITEDEIWDKSKADTLARILTLMQASWLVFQLAGRAILRLSTSTLELSAGAIVFCTFGTFICWFHKQSDVRKGIVLEIEATTEQILVEAGDAAAAPYRHTPLDFVAKESFTFGYEVMGFFNLRCDNRERPLRRFPNDRFPDISPLQKFALFFMTTTFASLHLIGWQFTFPTKTESLLWRISSSILAGTTLSFWVFETIAARERFGRWDKYLIWLRLKKQPHQQKVDEESSRHCEDTRTAIIAPTKNHVMPIARRDTVDCLNAFEEEQTRAKPLPLWEVALIFPVVILYAAARAYMIIEVLMSLRCLPLEVYRTFSVAEMLPHW
jgi:hypothetical protein